MAGTTHLSEGVSEPLSTKARMRKTIIRLAKRRQKPGSGSGKAFLRERTTLIRYPDLSQPFQNIDWAVVGAVATRLYMPERLTQDMDVLVLTADSPTARRQLRAAGFQHVGELSIGGSQWRSPDGFNIDLLECDAEWCRGALQEAAHNRDAHGLPILPLPYLVLMKFEASRAQDIADITRMLGQAGEADLDAVRALFDRYLLYEKDDLESLISLGQLEMQSED
ncbi:MAG: hypothetical protein KIT45_02455 [Fimbriimonadia bacterium]|nr:hypothetical protein [Fimbriimonadia bacterium]